MLFLLVSHIKRPNTIPLIIVVIIIITFVVIIVVVVVVVFNIVVVLVIKSDNYDIYYPNLSLAELNLRRTLDSDWPSCGRI